MSLAPQIPYGPQQLVLPPKPILIPAIVAASKNETPTYTPGLSSNTANSVPAQMAKAVTPLASPPPVYGPEQIVLPASPPMVFTNPVNTPIVYRDARTGLPITTAGSGTITGYQPGSTSAKFGPPGASYYAALGQLGPQALSHGPGLANILTTIPSTISSIPSKIAAILTPSIVTVTKSSSSTPLSAPIIPVKNVAPGPINITPVVTLTKSSDGVTSILSNATKLFTGNTNAIVKPVITIIPGTQDTAKFINDAQKQGIGTINVLDKQGNLLGKVRADQSGFDFINQLAGEQDLQLALPVIKYGISGLQNEQAIKDIVQSPLYSDATFDIIGPGGKVVATSNSDNAFYNVLKAQKEFGDISILPRFPVQNSLIGKLTIPSIVSTVTGLSPTEIKTGIGSFLAPASTIGLSVLSGIGTLTGGRLGIKSGVTEEQVQASVNKIYGETYLDNLLTGQTSILTPHEEAASLAGSAAFFGLGLFGGGSKVSKPGGLSFGRTIALPKIQNTINKITQALQVNRLISAKPVEVGSYDIGLNLAKPGKAFINMKAFNEQAGFLAKPGSVKVSTPPTPPPKPPVIPGGEGSSFTSTNINLGKGIGRLIPTGKGGSISDITKPSPPETPPKPSGKPSEKETTSKTGLVQVLKEPVVKPPESIFKIKPIYLGKGTVKAIERPVLKPVETISKVKPKFELNQAKKQQKYLDDLLKSKVETKSSEQVQTTKQTQAQKQTQKYLDELLRLKQKSKLKINQVTGQAYVVTPKQEQQTIQLPKIKFGRNLKYISKPTQIPKQTIKQVPKQKEKQKQRSLLIIPKQIVKPVQPIKVTQTTIPKIPVPQIPTIELPPPIKTPPSIITPPPTKTPPIEPPPIFGSFPVSGRGGGGKKRKGKESKGFFIYSVNPDIVGSITQEGVSEKTSSGSSKIFDNIDRKLSKITNRKLHI